MPYNENTGSTFHKDGLNALKLIHKVDRSAIPISMLKSTLKSLYPYINLFLSSYIIDSLLSKNYKGSIFYVIALIIGNFIFGIILDMLDQSTKFKSNEIEMTVQVNIRQKALSLDYESLENPTTLELINTADYSSQHRGGFGYLLSNYSLILESIISIVIAVFLVIYMCFQHSKSSGLLGIITSVPASCLILSTLFIITVIVNSKLAKYFNNKNLEMFDTQMIIERQWGYIMDKVITTYSTGKVIRIFGMRDMIMDEARKFKVGANKISKNFRKIREDNTISSTALSGFINGFSYIFVLLKIVSGAISIGSFTKYVGAISQLNNASIQLTKYNDEIRVQCTYLKSYVEFMNMENKRNTGTIPIEKRTDNEYEIEFHNVSFSYPGNSKEILSNVSCKITLKDKLAIVGRNGAGKTTFIKLLCRLYDPTSGVITLNGIDIKKYDYQEYLSLFGVVFQDFNLFAFPIEQNVSSSIDADEEKVWKCLELAGVKSRVEEMHDKLNTPLYKYDEGGVEISGGEAQKLAIARALYKDAPFVILDEPTAALDPISEYEIYSHFNELVKDKTSIYISHRMSSCRFCNDILVFHEGKIVQRGSHDELMKDIKKVYFKLWTSQAKYYVEV